MTCSPGSDRSFGPRVDPGCRNFDFTIQFEDLILACVPAAALLLLSCPVIALLVKKPPVQQNVYPTLVGAKLAAFFCAFALQLSFLAIRLRDPSTGSDVSLAADILGSAGVIGACALSTIGSQRSLRSPTVLELYLLASVLLGIPRVRTLWLLPPTWGSRRVAILAVIIQVFLVGILFLESVGPRSPPNTANGTETKATSPEQRSSLWSRTTYAWLASTFLKGRRNIISAKDLPPFDSTLQSDELCRQLTATWGKRDHQARHSFLKACFRTYITCFALVIVPRLCSIAFLFSQPFLVNATLNLMNNPDADSSHGKGLIGAWALVYCGIAASTSLHMYQNTRFINRLRGGLIAFIYQQSLKTRTSELGDITAVALMGTDVQRISDGMSSFHSTWSSLLEAGIACWLLQRQLSWACIAPIALVTVLIVVTSKVSALYSAAQRRWVEKIQERLRVTSAVLGDIKAIKMLGLSAVASSVVQGLRMDEIKTSTKFRKLLVAVILLSLSPLNLAPVVTFAVYVVIAVYWKNETLLTAQAFTSLALITLLTNPIIGFIQNLPEVTQCIGNFDRIQEYCNYHSVDATFDDASDRSAPRTGDGDLCLSELSHGGGATGSGLDHPSAGDIIELKSSGFAWDKHSPKTTLTDVAVGIKRGRLTAIIGPIGSGKTTFLNAFLGELNSTQHPISSDSGTAGDVPTEGGQGYCSPRFNGPIAYCAQQPWLENGSIRRNIVGASPWDWSWYKTVRSACCLDHDLRQLEKGDHTRVGSKGVNLSGGQKQRIALARAIYARHSVLLLDDVFSGMDAHSADFLFSQLFGRAGGLLRNQSTTVVLTTHNQKLIALVDNVIVLDSGRVVEIGSPNQLLQRESSYLRKIKSEAGENQDITEDLSTADLDVSVDTKPTKEAEEESLDEGELGVLADSSLTDVRRKNGELSVYSYYLSSSGYTLVFLYAVFVTLWEFCTLFPTVWLSWWSEANAAHPNDRIGMYMGVYAMLGVLGTTFACLAAGIAFLPMISTSAGRLHIDLLRTTLKAPFHYFGNTDIGELLNRFGEDMQLIDMDLPLGAVNFTSTAIRCLGQIIMLVVFSRSMGVALPFIFAFLYFLQRFYLQTSRQMRLLAIEAKAPLYAYFTEVESTSSGGAGSSAARGIGAGAVTIRAFGWEAFYQARASKLVDQSQHPAYMQSCIQSWLMFALNATVGVIAVIIVTTVVTWREELGIGPGGVGVSLIIIIGLSQSLAALITSWAHLETRVGAVARVRRFVTETESEGNPSLDLSPEWPKAGGALEVEDLVAAYRPGAGPVLKGISLSVPAGRHIAICGRSGSGKTSLVLSLLRMMDVRNGRVTLDGLEVGNASPVPPLPAEDIRARINVVPQDPFLIPNTTVRFNIDPHSGGSTEEEITAALQRVGLWDLVRDHGGLDGEIDALAISAGQKQLLCFARALVRRKKCDVLVLDEATSSLDHEAEGVVQDIIDTEFKDCTVLAVMHRLGHVACYDQVALMHDGLLVELGTPAELITGQTRFAELYKSHSK